MILASMILSMSVAQAAPAALMVSEPVTVVRTASPIIDMRQLIAGVDLDSGDYRLLDGASATSRSERERLGADDDAPAAIYVRAFDAVFMIDPFERVPQLIPRPIDENGRTLRAQRQLFGEFSLNTSRKLFNWDRVEATSELFRVLELARRDWLRSNGYLGVRTFTSDTPRRSAGASGEIRPRATFQRPDDMPRTRSREQVREDAAPTIEDAGAMIASSGETVRISAPTYDRSQVRMSIPGRDAGEPIAAR